MIKFRIKMSAGFTLLEMLVVISIISILVALGAASYTTVQQKGRDAQRRGDMKAVQNAFEQFYTIGTFYDGGCEVDLTIMPGGFPTDPKPDPWDYFRTSCSADTYCVCATLEDTSSGNSGTDNCTDWTGSGYQCISNLQ